MKAARKPATHAAATNVRRPDVAPPSPSPFRSALWISLALVIATLVVYAPMRHYDFVDFDDPLYVSQNPHLTGGLTAANVAWAFTAGYATNWHPLTWMSHMLDVQLFGLNAGAQHLTSLALHIANVLLLFWLLRRMTGATWQSAFIAALFAVHPLHVESVAWIAERKDVLSTLFWLLTMWAYVSYAQQPRWTRYLAVLVLFALGLMAKPMLVTLPFVLLLVDLWPLARLRLGLRRLILEKLPLLALAGSSIVVTYLVQLQGGAVAGLAVIALRRRIANALVSYIVYIVKMAWPRGLIVFYPYPAVIPAWQPITACLLLIGISIAAVRAWRRRPYIPVGWFWYVGTLVPVIGLVQVGRQALADRYTYVPLIGLFIVIAWGVPDLLTRRRQRSVPIAAAAVIAIAAYAIAAQRQLTYWENASILWTHELDVTPDSERAHNVVGLLLADQGKTADAISHFFEAVRIDPSYADAQKNLGAILAKQGRIDEAIAHYAEGLRLTPEDALAHTAIGVLLASRGDTAAALRHFDEALRLDPLSSQARDYLALTLHRLGLARAAEGEVDDAIHDFTDALRVRPDVAEVHNDLGFALASKGKPLDAIEQYSQALILKPNFVQARVNRGLALADQGDVREAIADFSEAVRLDPQNVGARRVLDALSKRAKSPSPGGGR